MYGVCIIPSGIFSPLLGGLLRSLHLHTHTYDRGRGKGREKGRWVSYVVARLLVQMAVISGIMSYTG